jgi:hypothetical protein
MENQQLQTTIDREIQVRQQVERQCRDMKSEMMEKNEFGFKFFIGERIAFFSSFDREIERLKKENEFIRKQLAIHSVTQTQGNIKITLIDNKLDLIFN